MYNILGIMSRQFIALRLEYLFSMPFLSFCILVCSLSVLTGCGSKSYQSQDPFIATDLGVITKSAPSPYLPDDDGIPLSPAEKNALMSVGAFDKDLSSRDMYDVVLHFKRYVHKERITIEKGVENGQKHITFMRQAMRQKGLPEELVYLAFVESLYRPKARSRTGALGLWQFISSTGKAYGMRQDYWVDERYDVYESTHAAATYLGKLHDRFDDWSLAITSYNAGQGKVARGLKATNTETFFELRRKNERLKGTKNYLTDENQQYYPKFLAVCKIMRNLPSLGFKSMNTRTAKAMTAIKVRPGTDLRALARTSSIPWATFVEDNPAYKRAISSSTRQTIAYVPRQTAKRAKAYLAKPRARTAEGFKAYKVVRGDTMARIAKKNRIPTQELRRLNPKSEPLRAGAVLALPRALAESSGSRGQAIVNSRKAYAQKKPAVKKTAKRAQPKRQVAQAKNSQGEKRVMYVVQAKDTIWGIARKFKVSPITILELNRLSRQSIIKSGDVLQVAVK